MKEFGKAMWGTFGMGEAANRYHSNMEQGYAPGYSGASGPRYGPISRNWITLTVHFPTAAELAEEAAALEKIKLRAAELDAAERANLRALQDVVDFKTELQAQLKIIDSDFRNEGKAVANQRPDNARERLDAIGQNEVEDSQMTKNEFQALIIKSMYGNVKGFDARRAAFSYHEVVFRGERIIKAVKAGIIDESTARKLMASIQDLNKNFADRQFQGLNLKQKFADKIRENRDHDSDPIIDTAAFILGRIFGEHRILLSSGERERIKDQDKEATQTLKQIETYLSTNFDQELIKLRNQSGKKE